MSSFNKRGVGHVRNMEHYEQLLYLSPYLSPQVELAVKNFVGRLPPTEGRFVTLRYLQRQTMEEVSEALGYSLRSVYRLRRRVLKLWILFARGRNLSMTMPTGDSRLMSLRA